MSTEYVISIATKQKLGRHFREATRPYDVVIASQYSGFSLPKNSMP